MDSPSHQGKLERRLEFPYTQLVGSITKELLAGRDMKIYEIKERMALGAYTVQRVLRVDKLDGWFVELCHIKSGARHIHILCPDNNKAFAVVFSTVPEDDKGTPHVLEHLVFTGSRRYPQHRALSTVLSRSLATYATAMTGPTRTFYPFTTRNAQDFENLLLFYLDSVFFPLLRPEAFQQEAWRYELRESSSGGTQLHLEGVVLNEMKGVLSSQQALVTRAIANALFRGTNYVFDSRGSPVALPSLSLNHVREYHLENYHPSNAVFFTYGDLDLTTVLHIIEERVLKHFRRSGDETLLLDAAGVAGGLGTGPGHRPPRREARGQLHSGEPGAGVATVTHNRYAARRGIQRRGLAALYP